MILQLVEIVIHNMLLNTTECQLFSDDKSEDGLKICMPIK